jgi:crotonobetainyl-CoA:carnitine CoA-transferase CaiB-like acyl-CoA transferase
MHIAVLTELFMSRTAREWEDCLQGCHVPAARVSTLAETAHEPQFKARGIVHRHDFVPGVDGPLAVPVAGFKFAHGGPRVDRPPPRVGENTLAILGELGYGDEDVARLRTSGAIGVPEQDHVAAAT